MVCMICCPYSRRTGSILVGIADLVIGSAALSAVGFLLYMISSEMSKLQEDYSVESNERFNILSGLYWSVLLSYVFPASVTLVIGIFTIFAVTHNSDCSAIAAILLTLIMVFVCAGILLILYIIRVEFPFLVPLIFGSIMHMFFTFVLLAYRSNDMKRQHSV